VCELPNPLVSFSASLCTSDQSAREEAYTQALLFFCIHRYLPCILEQPRAEIFHKLLSNERVKNNLVGAI
jgi:hypothetical protein